MMDLVLMLLIEAKSTGELDRAVRDGGAITGLTENCRRELQVEVVPVSCFGKLNYELERDLVSDDEFKRRSQALNSFCRRVARENKDLRKLRAASVSENLSETCRAAVKKRSDDLEYQIGEVRDLDRFLN